MRPATWVNVTFPSNSAQPDWKSAEEIESAAKVIPRSMIASVGINGVLGFAMLVATLFCLGDEQSVTQTPTHFPFLAVFQNATKSNAGTSVMVRLVPGTPCLPC